MAQAVPIIFQQPLLTIDRKTTSQMSKTSLKKQLALMERSDMEQLILELYEARKEAKEYLDFFVQPDIDAKLRRARTAIDKEAARVTRGRARPRVTRVKRFIKDITSLNPGAAPSCEIMTYTVERFCAVGSANWIKESTARSLAKLMADTVKAADLGGVLSLFLPRITAAVEAIRADKFYNSDFRELMTETLQDAINSLTCAPE